MLGHLQVLPFFQLCLHATPHVEKLPTHRVNELLTISLMLTLSLMFVLEGQQRTTLLVFKWQQNTAERQSVGDLSANCRSPTQQ